MKRTYRFVEPSAFVTCDIGRGERVELPLVAGILKHPTLEELARLLERPAVARKYTDEALRRAPWSAIRRFPRKWLLERMTEVSLPDGRRRALELLLATPSSASGPAGGAA